MAVAERIESISGRRVLVVEDQYLLAQELSRLLHRWGADVVGPAATLDGALKLLDAQPRIDLAVLDINLAGQGVYLLAGKLEALGVPFIFITGYAKADIRADFGHAPYLDKPFAAEKLAPLLEALAAAAPVAPTRH